ncbi:thiol-disulfide oxidoreductase DCC family protein [Brevundimonas aveniformis]|uniref:thiol-disulfide oxidoreductase DCC family protein n=1 Tax=Brevundimonas aveniformis TaxID=370977 RepID=UPI00041D557D|nr:DCC1-like thiol-disulfide oxidoreductase family protein [Brevundimonas aveniformis]
MKPVPAEGALEGIIFFDGVCVFCSRWVRWIMRRDKAGIYRFLPIQTPQGQVLAALFGLDPTDPQSNAVIRRGFALFKSDAAIAVVSSLQGWRWVKVFAIVPRVGRDWVYDLIARRRYRLFGKTDYCWIPEPGECDRLME